MLDNSKHRMFVKSHMLNAHLDQFNDNCASIHKKEPFSHDVMKSCITRMGMRDLYTHWKNTGYKNQL